MLKEIQLARIFPDGKTFVEEPGVCVCKGQTDRNHAGNVCKYQAKLDKCKQACEQHGPEACIGYWHGGGDWCHLIRSPQRTPATHSDHING